MGSYKSLWLGLTVGRLMYGGTSERSNPECHNSELQVLETWTKGYTLRSQSDTSKKIVLENTPCIFQDPTEPACHDDRRRKELDHSI